MPLRIHNTLTRRAEALTPIEPGHVRMYVCGITVYDLCHMGHARMILAFDVIYRWLLAKGYRVTYVRNITDIEDKIIRRAVERGMTIRGLTDEMVAAMHADFASLNTLAPTAEPRATEHVPRMLEIISRLQAKGLAYRGATGDMNFAVRRFEGYGKLSGKSLDQLRAGERVAVADDKEDPLDFVLWKSAKPDEPAEARWDSPFGPGRPGWHIECSAMSEALLGPSFDIHGGGQDLQFPHHENEIAQSEGANGCTFANLWVHNGFLNVDDEKMSKSLGNFFTIQDVLKRFDGETLRFFMLRTHYRSPFNFSDVNLEDARQALRRLYTALDGVVTAVKSVDWQEHHARAFESAMDDDFNTPGALASLFELAAEVNRARASGADATREASQLRALAGVLGFLQQDSQAYLRIGAGPAVDESEVERLIAERAQAKAARNFPRADAIRQELAAMGVELKDGQAGTTWIRS